jgi:hypothetical protein
MVFLEMMGKDRSEIKSGMGKRVKSQEDSELENLIATGSANAMKKKKMEFIKFPQMKKRLYLRIR